MNTGCQSPHRISVIVPSFNSAEFIADGIRSILNQTYPAYEIIVVDDGSTDNTAAVLLAFGDGIQCIYQENRGPAAARNAGIRIARGDYICFLDADDLWLPNKLQVQLDFMEQHPDIALVFSDMEEIDKGKVVHRSYFAKTMFRPDLDPSVPDAALKLLIENFILTPMVTARREVFAVAGLFDEALRVSEDRDLWARIAARFRIACLPLVLGRRRIHTNNVSDNVELTLRSRIHMWGNIGLQSNSRLVRCILNSLLANAHLHLGYVLFERHQRREVLQSGLRSLMFAVKYALSKKPLRDSLPRYQWFPGLALIPAAFIGYRVVGYLKIFRNAVLRRHGAQPRKIASSPPYCV
jgi:glycosyltransferase involved in cell wall biosynthesis